MTRHGGRDDDEAVAVLPENEREGSALGSAVLKILSPVQRLSPPMRTGKIVATLLSVATLVVTLGGRGASAQAVRVEAGGGWAIPSSNVTMTATSSGGQEGTATIDPGSGPQVYASVGLLWTVSDNFNLEGRLRAQQSRFPGDTGDFGCEGCTYSNDPDGRLRGITVEGQITLTSVGRIHPYFLVGLGVVRTTVDGVRVTTPNGTEIQFSEENVTDAGGDVGFGAWTRIVGGLHLTAEIRATGSLPGSKENAVTTFPFSLGVSYTIGGD